MHGRPAGRFRLRRLMSGFLNSNDAPAERRKGGAASDSALSGRSFRSRCSEAVADAGATGMIARLLRAAEAGEGALGDVLHVLELGEAVFDAGRQRLREGVFDTAADRVAGRGLAEALAGAWPVPVGALDVGDREAAGRVEQRRSDRVAEAQAQRALRVDLGLAAAAGIERGDRRVGETALDLAEFDIAFDAGDERAELIVRADMGAADEATRIEAVRDSRPRAGHAADSFRRGACPEARRDARALSRGHAGWARKRSAPGLSGPRCGRFRPAAARDSARRRSAGRQKRS